MSTESLLAKLVAAYEAQQDYQALREQLIKQLKMGEQRAYRWGIYNIQVMRGAVSPAKVEVVKVTALPEELPQGGCAGVQDRPHCVSMSGASSERIKEVIQGLDEAFLWEATTEGREYWRLVANKLRAMVGWSRV
jgi:hypothetical protein